MKKSKKILIIFLMVLFVFSFKNISFGNDSALENAKYSKDYQEYLKLSDEEKAKVNVIPRKYDVPFDVLYKNEETNVIKKAINKLRDLIGEEELPKSFILRSEDTDNNGIVNENDLELETYGGINIPIKNQGAYGLCWDFASIRSLETNLALHGYGDYDFSEWHVAYIEKNGFQNEINENSGANFDNFKHYFSNNYGPVLETEVPYGTNYSEDQFEYLYNIQSKAYLKETIDFPTLYKINGAVYDSNDNILSEDEIELFRNSVKSHIEKNGSVYISISSKYIKNINGYNTLYNPNDGWCDHALSVIGWDDEFSKENFRDRDGNMPQENGAYIALNSWGWEDIVFISYEDATVELNMSGIVNATTNIEEATKEIEFQDRNLYNAIKKELKKQLINYNDDILKITCVGSNNVTSLNLSNKGIENINGLEKFTNLNELNLSSNNITSIGVIQFLTSLNILDVSNNNIENINALSGLNNIQSLNLANNNIRDISCLINVEINRLDLSENPIETDISQLVNIKGIGLNNCNLDDSIIEILSGLQNLEQISLRNNNITDAYSLRQLQDLKELDLSGNKNINVNTIPYIDFSLNEINNKGGSEIIYTFKLILQNCNISDISFLEGFQGTELDLSNNPISDISPLKNVRANTISIRNASITDVSDLCNKTTIDLSGNKNLEGLENLERAFELTLNDCELQDISFISNMNNLCRLYIKNNNISDISPFLEHYSLFYLDMSGNTCDNDNIGNLYELSQHHTLVANNLKINKNISVMVNSENEISNEIIKYIYENRYENGYEGRTTFETNNCTYDINKDKIIIAPEELGEGQATITIKGGSFDGTIYTINYNAVENLELQSLSIVNQPKKLTYMTGENFNEEGLIIKEIYQNGVEIETKDYTIINGENLGSGQEKVIIASNKNPELRVEIDIAVYSPDEIITIQFPDANLYNVIKNNQYVERPYNMVLTYDDAINELVLKKEKVENLSIMDLTNKNISNIEGLEHFINLESLYLGRNGNLESIESLNNLDKLCNVQLLETNVNDIGKLLQKDNLNVLNISKTSYDIIGTNLEEFELPNPIYQSLTIQEGVTAEVNIYYDIVYDGESGLYYCTNTNHKTEEQVAIDEEHQKATIRLNKNVSEDMPIGPRMIEVIIHGGKTNGSIYTTFYNVEKELSSLRIYGGPNKSHYLPGDNFESEGMIVAAVYSDGSRREIDDYIVLDGEDLKIGQENVTISYTENGITKTDTQEIKVHNQEDLITINFPDDNLYSAMKDSNSLPDGGRGIYQNLIMSYNDDENDITMVKEIVNEVDSLHLMQRDISDITGIESFVNLERLFLSYNVNLESINQLTSLDKLEYIELQTTKVEDISVLLQKDSINKIIMRKDDQNIINAGMTEVVLPEFIYQSLTMQEGVNAEAYIYYSPECYEDYFFNDLDGEKKLTEVRIDEENHVAVALLDKELADDVDIGVRGIEVTIKGGKTDSALYIGFYNNLKEIEVTNQPTKTRYVVGEKFDIEGMKVCATYQDNSKLEINNYTILDGEDLKQDQDSITISYTQNGITKTTKQNINVSLTQEEIFNDNSTYFIDGENIIGINPNTSIIEFESNVKTQFEVQAFKSNELITTGEIGTGMIIIIKQNGQEIQRFIAIVKGDCNGDGMAEVRDMVKINNYRLYGTTTNFDEIYQYAGDVNCDGKIDIKDMVRINNYRLYGTAF